jgi:protein-disulfide isomerase
MNRKNSNQQQYTLDNHGSFDKLLGPVSSILSSVIISCAVLFAAITVNNNSIKKDDLAKIIAGINTANGTVAGAQDTTQAAAAVTVSLDQIKSLYAQGNVVFGDTSKKVLFVEVADPSCPYCHVAAGKNPELNVQMGEQFRLTSDGGTYVAPVPEMKKLVDEGKAAYVWLYRNGHGNGEQGAQALYCANEKGKFWEVHDLLMTNKGYNLLNTDVKNDKTKAPVLAEYVKEVIDPAFMVECLQSGKYATKIQEDQQLSTTLGVTGTPGYFINTTNFVGAYSYNDMKGTVETALGN